MQPASLENFAFEYEITSRGRVGAMGPSCYLPTGLAPGYIVAFVRRKTKKHLPQTSEFSCRNTQMMSKLSEKNVKKLARYCMVKHAGFSAPTIARASTLHKISEIVRLAVWHRCCAV